MDLVSDIKDKTVRSTNSAPMVQHAKAKRKMPSAILCVLILLVLLIGGGMLIFNRVVAGNEAVSSKEYQAVFLTNGQVYFGKLQNVGDDYLVLTKVYYLQVQQSVQPTTVTTDTATSNQAQLVKLGNELHGPEDKMQISSKQVLFWENLKPSGKVSEAISKYKP
jgi:flagellar basal body-associated protein FliL